MQDSPFRVIIVAFLLCLVCSVSVSVSAVLLKDRQDLNKKIDRQKNILSTVGLLPKQGSFTDQQVQKLYEKVVAVYADAKTGDESSSQQIQLQGLGQIINLSSEQGSGEERSFHQKLLLYKVFDDEKLSAFIIPIKGKGLWSTMLGYIALSADLQSVKGITFYEQAETPGLGGEVDNRNWQNQWRGKKIYDNQGKVCLSVEKNGNSKGSFGIDALSGATVTSRGVDFMVKFWLGPLAYGPYLRKQVFGEVGNS